MHWAWRAWSVYVDAWQRIVKSNCNNPDISSPAQAITLLDEGVFNALHRNNGVNQHDGMDVSICAVDLSNHKLKYAGAFRPILVWSENKISVYKPTSCSIGSFKERGITAEEHEIQLYPGDRVYMFSDGYVDQFGGERGKKFMSRRFVKMLDEFQHKSLIEQKRLLETTFTKWQGDLEQVDDVLVLAFEI
ncbi:MAG: SpoIIE family protein phosphatase [Flavobacteriales bacterium]|nr:SpoIIE family protein phosphatase [Flavobacteriales bacterium]